MWGELSSECGELSSECGASCHGASFLWGELSWGEFSLGRVVRNHCGTPDTISGPNLIQHHFLSFFLLLHLNPL